MSLEDVLKKFDDAPMTVGGVYLLPGDYKLKIREVKWGKAQTQGWDFFLAELEVVHSTNPERQEGSIVEWMVAFKNPQYEGTYLGNVKNFLFAAFAGFDPTVKPSDITQKVLSISISEQQPLRGKFIAATATEKIKKYAKNDDDTFTRVVFSAWGGPTE